MTAYAGDVSAVVVTYNALPWLERCLESVRGVETVVVDHGSTDGTVAFVRERFPEVALVEEENLGLAYGWNTGVARTSGRYVLLLNADAWLDDGALATHVAGAAHGGRFFREQVRGHLRFLAKHRGDAYAEHARQLLRGALVLRGALFRGGRGRTYRETAKWLGSGSVAELLA